MLSLAATAFSPCPRASLPSQPARGFVPSRAASLRVKAFLDPVTKTELEASLKSLETRLDDKLQKLEKNVDDKLQKLEKNVDDKLQKLEKNVDDKLQRLEQKLNSKLEGLQLVTIMGLIIMALNSTSDSILVRAVTAWLVNTIG